MLPELMTWTNAEGMGGEEGLSSASSKGFFPSEITAFKLWTHLEVTANMCSLWFLRIGDEIHMQGWEGFAVSVLTV